MRRPILEPGNREEQLKRCPVWRDEGNRISRTFKFSSYLEGVDFVNDLAKFAEEENHHPDILIAYRSVTVTLTTHDQGGVTILDVEMAERIDWIFD